MEQSKQSVDKVARRMNKQMEGQTDGAKLRYPNKVGGEQKLRLLQF